MVCSEREQRPVRRSLLWHLQVSANHLRVRPAVRYGQARPEVSRNFVGGDPYFPIQLQRLLSPIVDQGCISIALRISLFWELRQYSDTPSYCPPSWIFSRQKGV